MLVYLHYSKYIWETFFKVGKFRHHYEFSYLICDHLPRVRYIRDHACVTQVVPASVHQQQPLQEPELRDGKVCVVGCLHAFLATDTHTHTSALDHWYIVGAIPDC
jgi:hypothetical protein